MSNKYWAIFDKDGEIYADACPSEDSAWVAAWRKNICANKAVGYTCKQVVVLPVDEYEKMKSRIDFLEDCFIDN